MEEEKDPIQELREIRDQLSKKFRHDPVAMGKWLVEMQLKEKKAGRKLVSNRRKQKMKETGS